MILSSLTSAPVSSYDDIIDSRDIIALLEEWAELDEPMDENEEAEMEKLKAFAEEVKNVTSEYEDGATLVRDTYFTEYAEEYVRESGDMDNIPSWVENNISWEGVAEDLQEDFSQVEFDGQTYWLRSY